MKLAPNIYNPSGISLDTIDQLKNIYYSAECYETDNMKKLAGSKEAKQILKQEKNIDVDRITVCHFYKHSHPYYPHTDFHTDEKENIVIPLEVINGLNPYLIIFNQWFNGDGRTWTFRENLDFKYNKPLKGRPYDFDIHDKTEEDIPDSIYKYLNHQPKKYWFGLSGSAYEFKVGSFIQFDSKKIHATSKLLCESKLGLTIRYRA